MEGCVQARVCALVVVTGFVSTDALGAVGRVVGMPMGSEPCS